MERVNKIMTINLQKTNKQKALKMGVKTQCARD